MNNDYRGECCYAAVHQCLYGAATEVRGNCAKELTCWELERQQGGANKISGPKSYSGRVAHIACHEQALMRQKSGLTAGQESLL